MQTRFPRDENGKYIVDDAASYTVIAEDAPEGVYWLDEANLYAARYGIEKDEWGVEAWVTELKSTTAFSAVLCIKDLVQNIVSQTKKLYCGTEHEKTFHFYHDALGQLCHADTVAWMKDTMVTRHDTHNIRMLDQA